MLTKANHARKYNNPVSKTNQVWAGKVLGMEVNSRKGPDLIGNGKFAEVKFSLIKPKENNGYNYPCAWTVLEHQVEYETYFTGQGFWAAGLYELDRPFNKIRTFDTEEIESMIIHRDLYIMNWSWISQFPPHQTNGKTKISQWNHELRYPKLKDVPKIIQTYQVEKGLVHLTKGVPNYFFDLNSPEYRLLQEVPF